jgi:hypothetical protein
MLRIAPFIVLVFSVLAQNEKFTQINEHLQDLRWLIGRWESTANDRQAPLTVRDCECEWTLNNQFIEISMAIASPQGSVIATMSATILWHPSDHKIKYWGLGSDGRHSQAVLLSSDANRLVWEDRLVMPDGEVRTGTFT